MGQWTQEHIYYFKCKLKDKKGIYWIALFSLWDTPSKYCNILIFLMKVKLQVLFANRSLSGDSAIFVFN